MTTDINLPLLGFGVDTTSGGVVDTWMKANAGSYYCGISVDYDVSVHFTQDPGGTVTTAVEGYWMGLNSGSPEATAFTANAALVPVQKAVAAARMWGASLADQFSAENVNLGIETSVSPTEDAVLTLVSPVITALSVGSLRAAISRAKAISSGSYDSTFVTEARLLAYVNKCETYLGITLSVSL